MSANPLILGHLTVLDQPPPEVIKIASKVGFKQVGLRLLASRPEALSYPLNKDKSMLTETLRLMRETGVNVFDVDVCKLIPTTRIGDFEPMFEVAASLGAKSVLVTCGDADMARFKDNLDAFCDLAEKYALTADLEFMLFTPLVPTLPVALRIIEEVGRANLGVMVDTIHFDRTGAAPELLKTIPRNRLNYVHLTDARSERPTSLDDLTEDSRAYRMIPGEGGLDLMSIIKNLPRNLPLCVEVSNARLETIKSAMERAQMAFDGAHALLNKAA
jgi:sugar phosphate isomerase/epimerase